MAEFLDGMFHEQPETAEPETSVEQPAAPEAETPQELVTPEPEPQPERPDPGFIPIAAMMDERDKRRAAEARIAEFEAEQRRRSEQRQDIPDPFDKPDDYNAYVARQVNGALQQQKVDMSWTLAVRDHGQDATDAAKAWAVERAEKDPGFRQMLEVEFQRQPLPIDWIVQQHKRDALLTDIGDPSKLDDWFEREAAKRGWAKPSATDPVAASAVAVQQPAARANPPRSIASDTAPQGAPTAKDDKEGFLAAFR